MLSLHHRDDRLRKAHNLVPNAEGGMETRPGAIQVLSGRVDAAEPWGDRIIAERNGRIVVWDGSMHDIAPAGGVLQVSSFQALTANAARENRAYIADAVRSLWFIAFRSGSYVAETVINTVLDAHGAPYPIPIPSAIGTWRNRLWIDVGNRVQHCENDGPATWDPLWTVECQGKNPGRVLAIQPNGTALAVGLEHEVWQVTGTSQYNWQRDQALAFGVCGPNAIDGDGDRLAILSPFGVFLAGSSDPLTQDLRDLFLAELGFGELVVDTRRQLVLALAAGRLFAMHLAQPGLWGEIVGTRATGLIRTTKNIGWYGSDGVWLLAGRDTADKLLDGTESLVRSVYQTWPQGPNPDGNGRALCNRTIVLAQGSSRSNATYTVDAGAERFTTEFTLADQSVDAWSDDMSEAVAAPWPTDPVRRELVPRVAGENFVHTIEADCFMAIQGFNPQYRFGVPEAA